MPLKLRLTGSPNGKPDLQLQLFTLNLGEAAGNSHGRAGRGRQSPHLSGPGASLAPHCCSYLLGSAWMQATSTEGSRKQDDWQLGLVIIAVLPAQMLQRRWSRQRRCSSCSWCSRTASLLWCAGWRGLVQCLPARRQPLLPRRSNTETVWSAA